MEQKVPPHVRAMRTAAAKRREKMQTLRDGGLSLQAIGDKFGISRERIRQILNGK